MRNNLAPVAEKVDVIQCDIAHPPFKADSIGDIVICHNVIQHTESEKYSDRLVPYRQARW